MKEVDGGRNGGRSGLCGGLVGTEVLASGSDSFLTEKVKSVADLICIFDQPPKRTAVQVVGGMKDSDIEHRVEVEEFEVRCDHEVAQKCSSGHRCFKCIGGIGRQFIESEFKWCVEGIG